MVGFVDGNEPWTWLVQRWALRSTTWELSWGVSFLFLGADSFRMTRWILAVCVFAEKTAILQEPHAKFDLCSDFQESCFLLCVFLLLSVSRDSSPMIFMACHLPHYLKIPMSHLLIGNLRSYVALVSSRSRGPLLGLAWR